MRRILFYFFELLAFTLLLTIEVQGQTIQIISLGKTNETCSNAEDGTITIRIAGGKKPYVYNIVHGTDSRNSLETNDTVYTFTNIWATSWFVFVEDSLNSIVSGSINVGEPSAISISSAVITPISCAGFGDGKITVTASGESGSYIFTLNPGSNSNTTGIFTGLNPDIYTVTVVDAGTCNTSAITGPLAVNDPLPIGVNNASSTDITCNSFANGIINVSGTGGTNGYVYTLNPGAITVNNTGSFLGLNAGVYTVNITDGNTCPSVNTIALNINEPPVLVINSQASTNSNCYNADDGTISIIASGGSGIFSFTLMPGSVTNGSGLFSNVALGTYTVSVTDSKGCGPVISGNIVITEPPGLSIDNVSSENITCKDNNDGKITVSANGGTPGYSYTLNPGAITNVTGIFNGLVADSYTVSVLDSKGCPPEITSAIIINNPAVISISSQSSTNVTCNGTSNGTITIVATGGTGTMHYTLNPGSVSNTNGIFNGLSPDTYSVSVTDDNGCPAAVSAAITITEPSAIIITSQVSTNISCFGINSGTVTVTANGGTAPLLFTLNPGGINNLTGAFTNLSADTYTVSVTDAAGCLSVVSNSLFVTQPAALNISNESFSDITCNGNSDGQIQVIAGGGTPAYSYTLNPGGINNSTGIFGSLSQASYTVSITDANGCNPVVTSAINITEPAVISISSLSSMNLTCNGTSDGTINVVGSGGTGTLQYTLNPGAINNSTGVFNNLTDNTYTVTINDANACPSIVTGNIIITEPAIIDVEVDTSSLLRLACFNNSNGTIKILVSGGTAPFLFSWTGPSGFTSFDEDISGLRAGVYNLVITDSKSCSKSFPVLATIVEPTLLTSNVTSTNITCKGLTNGTVTISATGGTSPYTYSRVPNPYQVSNVFNGLNKNTYTFNTRDSSGCISTNTVTINEPLALLIPNEIKIDGNVCFGDSLGEIRIWDVSGGVTPYEYSINGGLDFYPTGIFQNLPAGGYQTIVRDSNGCLKNGNLNLINQPAKIFINNYTQADVTNCFGNNNGQIVIEAGGGTGSISYTLDSAINNTSGIFADVGGGNHIVTMTDTEACSIDTSVNLGEPSEQIFSELVITDVTGCPGDSNGAVKAVATGGAGSYSYSFNGGPFQPSGNFSSLTAGSFILSVKDANICVKDSIIIINEPAPISIQNQTSVNVTCASANNGSILVTAAGGTTPYIYVLNPGAVATNSTGSFNLLPPGNYIVEVTDNPGCGIINTLPIFITEPTSLVKDSVTSKGISCAGFNNAEIHIYSSGGTSPYTYSIDNGISYGKLKDFVGLTAGTNYLSLKDSLGCILNLDTLSFVEPLALTMVSESKLDIVSCNYDANGEVDFIVSGGTGGIEYSLDLLNWKVTGHVTGLLAGSYTVTARDQNLCTLSSSNLLINAPAAITADITTTPELNEFNKGTIIIANANGGTGTLEFSITGTGGIFSSKTSYDDISAGTYTVVVRDVNNCTFEQDAIVLSIPPLDVTVTLTKSSCNGDNMNSITMVCSNGTPLIEYSVDDSTSWLTSGSFTNMNPGTYYIFVRDGQKRYFQDTVLLTEPLSLNIFGSITPASCSSNSNDGAIDITVNGGTLPFTYQWTSGELTQDLTEINIGTYNLIVTDAKLCSDEKSFVVPALFTVVADAGQDTALCFGETFILNGQGGSLLSWSPTEGLSNPNIYNPVVSITDNATYILTAVDPNNCFDSDTINIIIRPDEGLNANNDTTVVINQEVTLVATGGTFTSYRWMPSEGLSTPNQSSTLAHPRVNTKYIVEAVTEFGCTERDTVLVKIIERLIVYDVFSPNNGDDKNNFFEIGNANFYPEILVEVYTRWGEKLFSSTGYSDDQRWDGTYKEKDVPIGTYYYVIVPYHGAEALTGPLTIVR